MRNKTVSTIGVAGGVLAASFCLPGCGVRQSGNNVPPSAAALPSALRFVDAASGAGLDYKWQIAGKRPLNILQTIGNGCAFLDYDNDGNLDILLVGPKLALYRGDGRGHFADVTQKMGLDKLSGHFLGCAVGDCDNDGFDDLYISGYHTGLLLHNDGGRGFTDITQKAGLTSQPWGTSCAFVEATPGSGRLDLFFANYVDFGDDPKKYQQFCLSHGISTSCGPRYYKSERDTFYRNDGHGNFADVSRAVGVSGTTGKGLGVVSAPLDDTRYPFIAVANDEMPGDLLRPNQSAGRLQYANIGTTSGTAFDRDGKIHGGMGIDWGDYDNDGGFDLFVATYQGESKSLYHNDGSLLFSDTSYQVGLAAATIPKLAFGCKFADFDNDGWLDLMIANGHVQDNVHDIDTSATYRQPTQLFRNAGGRQFVDLSASGGSDLQRPIVGRGLAIGDYDNDGRVDALVVDSEGAPLLLHNETASTGHWLSLTLIGTKSNRDGYGAVVVVKGSGGTQTRLCHSDGSYLSSSAKSVHIGMGAASVAQTVQIRWPSGQVDTFHDVPADHPYTAHEGDAHLQSHTH